MTPLTYHRPKTVEEALSLLEAGVPLAGGTRVVPQRRQLEAVIDLQDLGLNQTEALKSGWRMGATVTLQGLYDFASDRLPALATACRNEAALNIRNQATLAGALLSGEGRSPLLCALLALDPQLALEPASQSLSLQEFMETREEGEPRLVTDFEFSMPAGMAYEAVARSPMDRPLVVAAAIRGANGADAPSFRVALGGHGSAPISFTVSSPDEAAGLAEVAAEAYREAADPWASGEYRSAAAKTLVARVVQEVRN